MATKSTRYVSALDGSRGLGALFVLVAHYGYFQCGWVAVQYFFVLSGFLITSILLRQMERPLGSYLRTFYWRRVLRIFPIYFGYLAVCALALWLIGIPQSLRAAWPWLCTYTWNLRMMVNVDQLDRFFAHLWSLSAEEQFYILWPFVIFFLRGRWLKGVVIGILVAVPVLRLAHYFIGIHQGVPLPVIGRALYLGTMYQFDGFAAGAAIAIWRLDRFKGAARAFTVLLALLLVYAVFATLYLPDNTAFDPSKPAGLVRTGISLGFPLYMMPYAQCLWGYTAINLLSALYVMAMCQPTLVARFMENRFLCYTGKLSYGIYVLHFPLQHLFMRLMGVDPKTPLGFALMFVFIGLTIAIAHVSYYAYERRFLKLKDKWFT